MNLKSSLRTDKVTRQLAVVILCFLTFWVAQGCSAHYGKLRRSTEVTQSFESYEIFPNHKYYYTGLENRPYAIVALQQDYAIGSRFWNEFDSDPQKLKRLVDAIYEDRDYVYPYGAYLLDPDGKPVGMWYSSVSIVGVAVDQTNRIVSITTNQPWVRDDRGPYRGPGTRKNRH